MSDDKKDFGFRNLNPLITKEYLEQEYLVKLKTKAQIARELNICTQTLKKYCKFYSIPKNSYALYKGEDLKDKKYGILTVIRRSGVDDHKKSRWYCECDCGNTTIVNHASLIRNLTTSCGCSSTKNKRKAGYNDISGSFWRRTEQSANQRGYCFSITKEYVWDVYEKQNRKCFYTDLDIVFSPDSNRSALQTASIDRIDSSKGYEEGNIQIVHKSVNMIRGVYSSEDFICFCNLISKKHWREHEDCVQKMSGKCIYPTRFDSKEQS